MAGVRPVLVAEGCIRGNEDELERLRDIVRKAVQAGMLVRITSAVVVPDLGCGKLVALVGPRGGVHTVYFVRDGKPPLELTRLWLRHFKPTRIHNETLYEKVMKKAKR